MVETEGEGPIERLSYDPKDGVGSLVLVRWIDCTGYTRWTDLEEAESGTLLEVETVGRLLNQDGEVVRVASTRSSQRHVMHVNIIPAGNVLEITYLRVRRRGQGGVS